MPISSSSRVDQKTLATELGVTARRVRQLVQAHLLPPANDEGVYDLDRCRRYFKLYSDKTPYEWAHFFRELRDESVRVERLVRKASSASATEAELARAGKAAAELFDALRFAIAAKSQSDAERTFMRLIFDRLEVETYGPLISRTFHLLAAKQGLTADEIGQQIASHG
ncbi:MAG: hypothetical protein JJ864_07545 [Rhizobiaceae bacterium]|nr:hypothetical protein [Rhizobiaceae bacterium]